ncbi:MaoC family dehydratase N-terminal domain-containing protein [Nocardioides sp.]|uniref:FAS1-like dehydratase domain-containing protein n=1 Tax=Nocardioides sp. TaxID=35761 RepID=UPI00286E9A21|nr:MaoC family dehydratase N-terminal domain-containing protein [Nocardioides sp.]
MPVDQSLVGREFPPTSQRTVTPDEVAAFASALGGPIHGPVDGPVDGPAEATVPPTYPIVLAFDAMNAFLAAEQIDLFRIIHGEQRFAYERPIRVGDRLSATLTVASLRQIGGADIIGTTSAILDADGALVCTAKATLVHTGGPT